MTKGSEAPVSSFTRELLNRERKNLQRMVLRREKAFKEATDSLDEVERELARINS